MELSKDCIARVQCKDMESLVKASNSSKQVMENFTGSNDKYTYDIVIDHDELYYKLFLYNKKDLN